MMADPETLPELAALNDAVLKLQKSARHTIPMFLVGIVATLIAAAVAVFYIITLSANLRDARHALQQSQSALAEARGNLATLSSTLHETQKGASPAGAGAIANVIADVARSQNNIEAASSSISAATARITPDTRGSAGGSLGQIVGSCQLVIGAVRYLTGPCRIELASGGSFRVQSMVDTGPSASVNREGQLGTGSWQSGPGQPLVQLGALQRQGACWSNDNATVCAWR